MLEAVNLYKVFFQLCIYIGSFDGTELYTVVICYITSPFYIRVCAQLLIMIRKRLLNSAIPNFVAFIVVILGWHCLVFLSIPFFFPTFFRRNFCFPPAWLSFSI